MKKKESIREELKNNHFGKAPADPKQALTTNDEAIHEILVKVLTKWRTEKAVEKDTEHEEWQETIVLSPRGGIQRGPSNALQDKDEMPETVIISPPGTGEEYVRPMRRSQSEDLQPLDETVSLQGKKRGALPKKDIRKSLDQDVLTETVILKPDKEKDKKKD